MKKLIQLAFICLTSLPVISQTKLTPLPATGVKSHFVIPVKVEGTSDYFFFEGFTGLKNGCLKIDTGAIDLTKCDKFIFEFAEFYEGNPNIPLYYIRRTDGLYLSFQLGGAAFVNKITDTQSRFQKWLISKVQSQYSPNYINAYNFLLPLAPVQYGYTLKVFNNQKELGFSDGPKIIAFESEFYLGQESKKGNLNGGRTRF